MSEPTIQDFIEWANKCGHYVVAEMYENFCKFIESEKEQEQSK